MTVRGWLKIAITCAALSLGASVGQWLRIRSLEPKAATLDRLCGMARHALDLTAQQLASDAVVSSVGHTEGTGVELLNACMPAPFPWELWEVCRGAGDRACLASILSAAAQSLQ